MNISFSGYRTGFPFVLKYKSANGDPFELWDGSTVDGSGIPSASSGADVYGQGTMHPIGLTIGEMAELYWRIRKLIVNYDYEFTYDEGTYSTGAYSGILSPIQIPYLTDADYEFELCDAVDNPGHFGYEVLTTIGNSSLEVTYNDVWVIGDLYYPSIKIGMGGIYNTVGDGSEFGALSNPVSSLTVGFLGFGSLNLWGSNVLATVGKSPPYSGTGTITIAGDTWWSYGGKFDTSDGARL